MPEQTPEAAPVLYVALPKRRADLQARLAEKLPNLAERSEQLGLGGDPNELVGSVIATRSFGREFVESYPEIDASKRVLIDCMWVEVLTSPPVHEILRAWPLAEFFNCNEDVSETVKYVRERLA